MKKSITVLVIFNFLLACSSVTEKQTAVASTPEYQKKVYYDGVTDDLLTAGLGLPGLRGNAPDLSAEPTAGELRKASYYHQFKALNDLTEAGGYGRLYGFNEDQKPIAGTEYWAQRNIKAGPLHTVVVQIPEIMNPNQPCLVVAPSSGSRNVLGSVGTSGSWALLHGCAVVYTDKGTGTEIALSNGNTYQIDGVVVPNSASENELKSKHELQASSPLHVVQKHPYSQENPEKYWGEFVLDAAQYGLSLLNTEYNLTREQIHVIAASLSNGGGAVLRAAEKDSYGIIDAVVAAEPQVNVKHEFELIQGQQTNEITSLPLLSISTMLSLYEPCAALHQSLQDAPFKANTIMIQPLLVQRCQALADAGLVAGEDTNAQAADALKKIKSIHIEQAALQLSQLNTLAGMWAAINHTYANSYLQKTADNNLCQSAMSAFNATGKPRALSDAEITNMFAQSNGIAPSNGVELGYTNDENEVQSRMILAPNYGLSSQLCFYQLSQSVEMKKALQNVISEPHKNQVPTVILHGQADGTVAVNHSSRAYYHSNQTAKVPNKNLHYYEIKHVQHFDAFLTYPGFKEKFVPMHPYFEQAMNMMLNHLRTGNSLAPSQVVETKSRGQESDLLSEHIPAITRQPDQRIKVVNNQLVIQ